MGRNYIRDKLSQFKGRPLTLIPVVPELTAGVDWWPLSNLTENAHWHAMSDGERKQRPKEAEINTNEYIDKYLRTCTEKGLARALHAGQDKHPKGHKGYQPYYGPPPGLLHMWYDSFGAIGAPLHAALGESRGIIKKFKSLCPCICKAE